jgi:hypothetical protein
MTKPATFKQADYDRLFKSATTAGFEGVRLVIDPATGTIDATFLKNAESLPRDEKEWDNV